MTTANKEFMNELDALLTAVNGSVDGLSGVLGEFKQSLNLHDDPALAEKALLEAFLEWKRLTVAVDEAAAIMELHREHFAKVRIKQLSTLADSTASTEPTEVSGHGTPNAQATETNSVDKKGNPNDD